MFFQLRPVKPPRAPTDCQAEAKHHAPSIPSLRMVPGSNNVTAPGLERDQVGEVRKQTEGTLACPIRSLHLSVSGQGV